MKTAIICIVVGLCILLGGCALIQDSTEVTGRASEVYTEVTDLQEKLSPYIENTEALGDLNLLLKKTKLLLTTDVNSELVKSIRTEAKALVPIFREEANRRWDEIPVDVQAELTKLDEDLIALDLAVADYLTGHADAVTTGKKIVDFGHYAFKIYKLVDEVKN